MMDQLSLILTGAAVGVIAQWLLAAVSHALPSPRLDEGRGYIFFYRLVHFISANFDRMKRGLPPKPQDRPARPD